MLFSAGRASAEKATGWLCKGSAFKESRFLIVYRLCHHGNVECTRALLMKDAAATLFSDLGVDVCRLKPSEKSCFTHVLTTHADVGS
jgi:hypothetical protein